MPAVSSLGLLQLYSMDNPERLFSHPDGMITLRVGNASDLVVEIRCVPSDNPSRFGGDMNWNFAENMTTVPRGLTAFGTSQSDGGTLRIYPANRLSQNGAKID